MLVYSWWDDDRGGKKGVRKKEKKGQQCFNRERLMPF